MIPETPLEYFVDIYMINGFPVDDYREFLVYSPGAGVSAGVKGFGHSNSVFFVYLESAYNATTNPDINYAITLQGGVGAGYDFTFTHIHVIPEISLGYIYSFYDVKYSDMETFYRNIIIRGSCEINTELFSKILFMQPALSFIFEDDDTLLSIDFLLGIKTKI